MCANMYVRDIVSSDQEYAHTQEFPKELSFNPSFVARTKELIDDYVVWYPPKPKQRRAAPADLIAEQSNTKDAENLECSFNFLSVGSSPSRQLPRGTKSPAELREGVHHSSF